jgi:hypothetical protein
MGIRLPSIPVSKYTVLVAAQLVLNVSLAVWLYNEYLHNPFMQMYMSGVWSGIWPEAALSIGIAAGAAATLTVYRRGHLNMILKDAAAIGVAQPVGTSAHLATIDMCPFCDMPLKTISEGRLQCRNCRRYFKSSLPKVAA